MATDEDIPVVSEVENARKSDGTSTAGEHNVDFEEKPTTEEENKPDDQIKKDNNKRDINEIEKDEEKSNDNEIVEPSTTDKKVKIIDSSTDEESPKEPNDELTIILNMATSSKSIEIQDEEANASFLLGKRDVLLNNYQAACDHLSKTCERIVKLRGSDTAPELAEPYFYYGQALLYLGLSEQQVFGSDVVKDTDNDENEIIEEENNAEDENGDDSIPDDENVNDLERAFEILECAHMIYSTMSETDPNNAHIITRLADIHIMLGDICNENGDHENALSHVLKAIELQETINEQQRYRLLAESYYKLGLIYELISKFSEAVDSFNKAIDSINQAIKQSDGEDKENEREELKSLLPSIELKRNDAQASISDRHLIAQARKILSGTTNTTDNSTTEAPAKDITLNIRHKRPIDETDDTNKKSKAE